MNKLFTYLLVVTMFIAASDAFAQWSDKTVKKALKCYETNLKHENYGVVKSSISNILKIKVIYPERNSSKIVEKLEKLSFESKSGSVRYDAYVAANFLKYPEQFNWDLPDKYEELDNFFQSIKFEFDEQIAKAK